MTPYYGKLLERSVSGRYCLVIKPVVQHGGVSCELSKTTYGVICYTWLKAISHVMLVGVWDLMQYCCCFVIIEKYRIFSSI